MIPFLIKNCPVCNTKLKIEKGQKTDVIKLVCPNLECEGSSLKRLQKGIEALDIKALGPATIQKLYNVGITSTLDLFNSDIFNSETLINSGEFKEGRNLEIILNSVANIKEIKIDKLILSLQLLVKKHNEDGYISIGKSLSEQIGKMISNVPFTFENLSIQIRDDIQDKNSQLYLSIIDKIKQFEEFGLNIIYYKVAEKKEFKKIKKIVSFEKEPIELNITIDEIINKLEWENVSLDDEKCILFITDNINSDLSIEAKKKAIKVITFKQLKLMYL